MQDGITPTRTGQKKLFTYASLIQRFKYARALSIKLSIKNFKLDIKLCLELFKVVDKCRTNLTLKICQKYLLFMQREIVM